MVYQPEHSRLAQGLFSTFTFHHTLTGQDPGFPRLKIRFGAPHPRRLVSELFCTGGRWRGDGPPGWFLRGGDRCLRSILFRLKLRLPSIGIPDNFHIQHPATLTVIRAICEDVGYLCTEVRWNGRKRIDPDAWIGQ